MNRLALLHRRVRQVVLARRRTLAALCAATAVGAAILATTAPPPPTERVLTAARDVPAGERLTAADLRPVRFPPAAVPSGAVSRGDLAVGRTTSGPLRAGEPITDVRLVTGSLLAGYPGLVAVPVRIGDAGAVGLLRVGDRVDVLAADPQGRDQAALVAEDSPVVAIPQEAETSTGLATGGLVVLAVPDVTARSLAEAGVSRYLSVVIGPR